MSGFTRMAVGAGIATAAALWLNPVVASADTIPFSGSASIEIPQTPAGDMGFTLTVNGQEHDFSNVDNSLGGRLTLTWVGSQEAPRTTTQDCADGAPGGGILLEEATPSLSVWATWTSPTSHQVLGPAEVPSRDGFVLATACLGEKAEPPGDDDGDPSGGDPSGGDPAGGGENPPCAQNQGNGNGHGNGQGNGNGSGSGNANGGQGNGNGNGGQGNGNGNGNAYGHLCD